LRISPEVNSSYISKLRQFSIVTVLWEGQWAFTHYKCLQRQRNTVFRVTYCLWATGWVGLHQRLFVSIFL